MSSNRPKSLSWWPSWLMDILDFIYAHILNMKVAFIFGWREIKQKSKTIWRWLMKNKELSNWCDCAKRIWLKYILYDEWSPQFRSCVDLFLVYAFYSSRVVFISYAINLWHELNVLRFCYANHFGFNEKVRNKKSWKMSCHELNDKNKSCMNFCFT